jgi:diacylglycerol kinase (ATP)
VPGSRPYDTVVLVYNPHASGDGERLAKDCRVAVEGAAPDLTVRIEPTQYAGHARVIAEQAARAGRALVVSVSGDGGYQEVVEGVMAAGDGTHSGAVTAVLPAGNANDHRRATRERPLSDAIAAGTVRQLDLLRLQVGDGEPPRWAHSYVGLGLTPTVALELEKGGKGSLREIVTTIRTFARFRPFEIDVDGVGPRRFDSLILANTSEMAKYATLSRGDPADGVFEVVTLPHRSRLRLIAYALRAAVRGLGPQPTARRYGFTTSSPIPMQLDGEVTELGAGTRVCVEIAPRALTTVL